MGINLWLQVAKIWNYYFIQNEKKTCKKIHQRTRKMNLYEKKLWLDFLTVSLDT